MFRYLQYFLRQNFCRYFSVNKEKSSLIFESPRSNVNLHDQISAQPITGQIYGLKIPMRTTIYRQSVYSDPYKLNVFGENWGWTSPRSDENHHFKLPTKFFQAGFSKEVYFHPNHQSGILWTMRVRTGWSGSSGQKVTRTANHFSMPSWTSYYYGTQKKNFSFSC